MLLLPRDHVMENFLDGFFVADEVVVDDEDKRHVLRDKAVELRSDLRRRLEARLASENHDDVAELTGERAAARELDRAKGIVAHIEEIEPWRRNAAEISPLSLFVAWLMRAAFPVSKEFRPCFLRLTN